MPALPVVAMGVTPRHPLPKLQILNMIAVLGSGLNTDGTAGVITPEATNNDASAHVASRQYFDAWCEGGEKY